MKGIYKTIIGIATTGAVATASIVTANVLSENKENEETKPVAIVNEMKNTINEENEIGDNTVDSNIENNVQDNNIQKNNAATKTDVAIDDKQPVAEVPRKPIEDNENAALPVEKEVTLNMHLKRNTDNEEAMTYTIFIRQDDTETYEEIVEIKDSIDLAINLKGDAATHRVHIFINDAIIAVRDIDFKTQSSYDFSFELSS